MRREHLLTRCLQLSKGQLVDIEGRLQTRQWDDDGGGKRQDRTGESCRFGGEARTAVVDSVQGDEAGSGGSTAPRLDPGHLLCDAVTVLGLARMPRSEPALLLPPAPRFQLALRLRLRSQRWETRFPSQ